MNWVQRQPLRVKLVALVLALLTLAIVLIGVASNVAIGRYLTQKVDDDLDVAADHLNVVLERLSVDPTLYAAQILPSDFVALIPGLDPIRFSGLGGDALPAVPDKVTDIVGTHKTLRAKDGKHRWRVVVSELPRGPKYLVAQSLSDVDGLKNAVLWTTIYGGASVLILAASLGTEMVRRSLRPLTTIEKTAGAIAGGDLTKRVPDPEEGEPEPRTEFGSLARSLNTMLAQIEHAFTAQAASETAARAAEAVARDAAVAAQVSEARARRSEEKMRQFVADASHELRTPLTTIRGFAELYRQGAAGTPEKTAQLVKRIEDEARRMGLLVEDLLLLARMDQERPLRPGPVELRVVAVDAVQAARVVAPDREIALAVAPDAGELVVRADDARLRQIINNLMGNALAHTPPGTPIELRLSRAGTEAVVEVVDHGPGLTAEQQERVFERFYRADSARTRRADGHVSTGLGLAIVAALVSAHDGKVEVDSRPGEGATFRVFLPLLPQIDEEE
ncbi:sensor histidine kinase [Allorhizocola rhizosphaerae]|uniref:sensor histidine kinase n=1 Tax=Allorhizocola rhizosphaerae TaxID=1872709 RepID=UPI000E3C93CE|nr:HAMP domain-containing sensor histidine kinase [Allorhizocola rhizosphaerae]